MKHNHKNIVTAIKSRRKKSCSFHHAKHSCVMLLIEYTWLSSYCNHKLWEGVVVSLFLKTKEHFIFHREKQQLIRWRAGTDAVLSACYRACVSITHCNLGKHKQGTKHVHLLTAHLLHLEGYTANTENKMQSRHFFYSSRAHFLNLFFFVETWDINVGTNIMKY